MKRLFVGVPVSDEVRKRVKSIYENLKETGADLKFVSLENLHLTVKFLGDVEEGRIPSIIKILNALQQKKFTISLKNVGVFPSFDRIKVIWIGMEGKEFLPLMRGVNEKLDYIRKENRQEEVPHLTVARVKSGRNKEQLLRVLREVGATEFGQMILDKVVLYESELKPNGPIYTVVEEFGLE